VARPQAGTARLVQAAPVFAALGDPSRLRIVARLCEGGPLNIVRLTEGGAVTRQAVAKHLRALEQAGLVSSMRAGRERIWELETRRLAEASHWLSVISTQWDQALGRLKVFVEREA
jgi:DNA-binding transcriptional ArsR family regulator